MVERQDQIQSLAAISFGFVQGIDGETLAAGCGIILKGFIGLGRASVMVCQHFGNLEEPIGAAPFDLLCDSEMQCLALRGQ